MVDDILGGDGPMGGVETVRLRSTKASDQIRDVAVEGLFVAIGHDPATRLFAGKLDMDDEGYILTAPDSTATSIPAYMRRGM